jgi:hypothetical protein
MRPPPTRTCRSMRRRADETCSWPVGTYSESTTTRAPYHDAMMYLSYFVSAFLHMTQSVIERDSGRISIGLEA